MTTGELFFIESLGSLYTDVQLQEVFPDSKFFVDCIPAGNPAAIQTAYEKEKKQPGFDLKKFVTIHFILPAESTATQEPVHKPIGKHLYDLWNELERAPDHTLQGTLISLPFPYIVPGGRFREVYYWDSYFTMLGLQVSGRIDIIQNMVDNFAYLVDKIGFIPNGNRTYYLGRSQPPFFALMIELLSEEKGEGIFIKYREALEKEYDFWMDGEKNLSASRNSIRRVVQLPDGNVLNRYWDDNDTPRPEAYIEDMQIAKKSNKKAEVVYRHIRAAAESGWDFSSRWFKDGQNMETIQTTNLIPVDLNCLLLHTEELLLQIYTLTQDPALIKSFRQKVNNRKAAIQYYCWNEDNKFYFDYNFTDNKQSNLFTLAAVYPLFFSIATPVQAKQVAEMVEEKLLQEGGLVTTLYATAQQWDAPNGWAPLQWMTYKGLKNYGHIKLAGKIKQRWASINERVYTATGKMMEKYNVVDITTSACGGEYPNQDGFGWTNGVFLKFSAEG